jgi:hypothetical protein
MKAASAQTSMGRQRFAVPDDPLWPEKMKTRAMAYLKRYDSCTQSILWAFMEALGTEDRMVLRAGAAMHGGMMSSLTCGVHTAGLMVLGLLAGRETLESGLDGMMPIILPAQRMVKTLTGRIGGHSCLEITGVDFTDLEAAMTYRLSGDHQRCVDRVGDGARTIAELLQEMNAKGELFRF